MGIREKNQKSVHKFLVDKFNNGENFPIDDLRAVTDLTKSSFKTFFSKHIKGLVYQASVSSEILSVNEAFQKFLQWKNFKEHVSQTRIATNYVCLSYANVIVYDFFMPLANESYLRTALDSLFYRETIERRLKALASNSMVRYFARKTVETDESYYGRICDWISSRFIGYSILHVNGRFRADDLKRASDIYSVSNPTAVRYIVDETTAIVRFIFPIGEPVEHSTVPNEKSIEAFLETGSAKLNEIMANKIRWVFYSLFVQSIVQLANKEDEIWLLESGFVNRLHKWVKKT